MALPINVPDLLRSSSKINAEREQPLRIVIVIEPDAPDELIDAVRDRFRPGTSNARLQIEVAEPDVRVPLRDTSDAVIAVVGSGRSGIAATLAEARDRAIPALAVGLADSLRDVAEYVAHPYADTVAALDGARVIDDEVSAWLVERLSGKRLALAHNFAFMRKAVADEAVKATALQNALIGTVVIIPGADMPLMTLNQAKMLLQIAAAYGQRLGAERVKELAAVVGGGFALRAVARQLLVFVPGFGWAVKGAIAYGGTIAMGKAAVGYFEEGFDLAEIAGKLVEVRDAAVERIRRDKHALKHTAAELAEARDARADDDPSEF
ncbi:MAG: hypothetical protein K0B85_08290 [Coriobacteriia bacterium]|nr:hypothetical protein [Coriobacteriia bacterium]